VSNRRAFVKLFFGAGATVVLAACSNAAPAAPTAAPAPTSAPAPTTAPAPAAPTSAAAPTTAASAGPTTAAAPTQAPAAASPAATTAAQTSASPDTWIVGNSAATPVVDLTGPTGATTAYALLGHIYDSLVDVGDNDLKLKPMLATEWKQTDPLTWRFQLRKGVKYHDGTEFKAADVEYSYGKYMVKGAWSNTYSNQIDKVTVVDDYTVDLKTKQPSSVFLFDLSRLYIVPKAAHEQMGFDQFNKTPIGSGPYKLTSWTPNDRMNLQVNPSYWRGTVSPKNLVIRFITDATTRDAELLSGGVHIIYGPANAQIPDIQKNAQTQIIAAKGGRSMAYLFNQTKPPFNDVRVRQAMNYGIDRQTIFDTILQGNGVLVAGPLGPGWIGYTPDLKPYPYDPDKAKSLLKDAGFASGFKTSWKHTKDVYLNDVEIVQAIAGQLSKIGVNIELIPVELAQENKDQATGNFDGMITGAWGVSADPANYIHYYFVDHPAFVIPQLKDVYLKAEAETDPAKHAALLQDFNKAAMDQAAFLFLHAQDEIWAKRKEVPWQLANTSNSKAYTFYFDTSKLSP
jgi:peptide/nickel transport system substrate-binding protein